MVVAVVVAVVDEEGGVEEGVAVKEEGDKI